MSKKSGLGRGLAALLEPSEGVTTLSQEVHESKTTLPIEKLSAGKYQPRTQFNETEMEELTNSVREKGIIQPILVRFIEAEGRYEIIAGERRWRAARRVGLTEVPVVISKYTDREALEVSIIENIQRHDLNPIEEAEGFGRLLNEFNHTQDELAKALGKSRSYIANSLRLNNLPNEVKDHVKAGKLTAGHARALITAENPHALAEQVIRDNLNVRQTEHLVQKRDPGKEQKPPVQKVYRDLPSQEKSADQQYIEEKLTECLGVKASLEMQGEKGKICLHFDSLDHLDSLLQRLEAVKDYN